MGAADNLKMLIQHAGAVDKSVAVHDAVAGVFRLGKPGNQAEHPALLRKGQPGLKAHQVIQAVRRVVLAQL
jgi:hypothetical protein